MLLQIPEYADLVEVQIGVKGEQLLLEPEGRNTAPAIASYKIYSKDRKANLVISPADHFIANQVGLEETINKAIDFSSEGNNIVTIGIFHQADPILDMVILKNRRRRFSEQPLIIKVPAS